MFVHVDDLRSPLRRSSRATRFGLAAAASLAGGILLGFASGYLSAQRLTTPSVTVPPLSTRAPRTVPEPPVAGAASASGDAVKRTPESVVPQPVTELPVAPRAASRRPQPAESALDREPAGTPVEPRVPVATSFRARQGSIEVLSRPAGADVSLDGQIVGQTPLTISNVQEGTHVIGIELSGFSRWATSVRVEAGKPARIGASLTP